jgi:hypothetical protein
MWPDNPRIVIASRAEVEEPSETSTRSGFEACAETAMPDIIPGASGFVSRIQRHIRRFRHPWRGLPCSGIHGQITGIADI